MMPNSLLDCRTRSLVSSARALELAQAGAYVHFSGLPPRLRPTPPWWTQSPALAIFRIDLLEERASR